MQVQNILVFVWLGLVMGGLNPALCYKTYKYYAVKHIKKGC